MSKYFYQARDHHGSIVEGSIRAETAWHATKTLKKNDLVVFNISRLNFKIIWKEYKTKLRAMTEPVNLEEKLVLMSQLETGVSIGIPILQMFQVLQRDLENKFLKSALAEITEDISEGSSIHEAFRKHPQVFNPTVIGLVKTGEVSGKLEASLGRISTLIEQQAKNLSKVNSAVFYPKIVISVVGVVMVIAIYVLIPKLKQFLTAYGAELPPLTQFVIGASNLFVSYWYVLVATVLSVYVGIQNYVSDPIRKLKYDRAKLKTPLFGKIFVLIELNNFCVVLSLLIQSGVTLISALDILKGSQSNEVFKYALTNAIEKISKGESLSSGLADPTIFPATFRNMLSVGEESGRLESILDRMGRYYQTQIDYKLDNLSKLIEPILLFFIFGMVLILALALLLPIWKMNKAMLGH